MKYFYRIITLTSALTILALGLVTTAPSRQTFALTAQQQVCGGVGVVTNEGGAECQLPAGSVNVPKIIAFAVNILSVTVGIVAVIMLMVGGYKYVTSQGEPNNVASAKATILYALAGVVIAASAQIIVRFVLKQLADS